MRKDLLFIILVFAFILDDLYSFKFTHYNT